MTQLNQSSQLSQSAPCLGCGHHFPDVFLDLGLMPLANSYPPADTAGPDPLHPLSVAYCPKCHLVQIAATVPPEEMFTDYLYFSSFSPAFLRHAASMAEELSERFALGSGNLVVEIASNDGYLLENFVKRGVPVLGVEPARNIAAVSISKGIPTLCDFFGEAVAGRISSVHGRADLIIGNNVLAHVPEINGFMRGVKSLLKPAGAAVFEVPWLREFINKAEFDTVYHEHVFYYSLNALKILGERAGLELFDAEPQMVHGGSLRVFFCHPGAHAMSARVSEALALEVEEGLTGPDVFKNFSVRVEALKRDALSFLQSERAMGHRVAGYGAAAKASVFLNYCGIGPELIGRIADRSTYKQGRLMPGVRIPIVSPEALLSEPPDILLILAWNFRDEIISQMGPLRQKGCRFAVAVPRMEVLG